ncbi:MAG: hypothetical protein ACI9XC_000312 [Gammaproteobacteria bacterium]|jgi:hypothetical protein
MIRPVQSLLLILGLFFIFVLAGALFTDSSLSPSKKINSIQLPQSDEDILVTSEVSNNVHVGEPFEYKLRVIYRPEKVRPDFRQLLRDVRFVPFEQLHRSRTSIIETVYSAEYSEYVLAYTVVGIDVVPGNEYALDSVKLNYTEIETDQMGFIELVPEIVTIDMYSQQNALDIPFQPIKGKMMDDTIYKRLVIIFCISIFLIFGLGLLWAAIRKKTRFGHSIADKLYGQIEKLRIQQGNKRQKIIQYEKIIMSLFKHYGNRTAKAFWAPQTDLGQPFWMERSSQLKQPLETAYSITDPNDNDIQIIEENIENVYLKIDQESADERLIVLNKLEGTKLQRIARHKFTFAGGVAGTLICLMFVYLLISPELWMDKDATIFNNWIGSLPERILDESNDHDMGTLDVEMLGHISDQQQVLENLQSDIVRSAYLYDYGTLVGKIFKVILTMPPADEEEEATEPPSFEFPVQLLANSARFYPFDEDIRRNLEVVIRLKERQDNKDSGEIQGELGPPTPGFSRDMNPLLF